MVATIKRDWPKIWPPQMESNRPGPGTKVTALEKTRPGLPGQPKTSPYKRQPGLPGLKSSVPEFLHFNIFLEDQFIVVNENRLDFVCKEGSL